MEEQAVVYLSGGETKELIETNTSYKCGEVFRSTSGASCTYSLCCSHCNLSFLCLAGFSQHIEEHFQLISIATLNNPNGELVAAADHFKGEILESIVIKEEPEFRISEIKVESNNSHLTKKRARKKVKHPEGDSDSLPKYTKSKVNKTSKALKEPTKSKVNKTSKGSKALKEPTNNIFVCDDCGKIFSTKNHISQHIKLHRKAPKEHKCYLCGWEFYEKGNLTRHLRTHNNDPKAFKCEICNKCIVYIMSKEGFKYITNNFEFFSRRFCPRTLP